MPSAISASSSASVPDDTAMAWRTPSSARQLALERVDLRSHDEALAVADAGDGGEDLVAQRAVLGVRDRAEATRHGDYCYEAFYRLASTSTAARVSRSVSRRLIVSRLS